MHQVFDLNFFFLGEPHFLDEHKFRKFADREAIVPIIVHFSSPFRFFVILFRSPLFLPFLRTRGQ